jgi:hypothetical protein
MSLLDCDSYDHYATAHLGRKVAALPTSSTYYDILPAVGRCGSQCLEVTSDWVYRGVQATTTSGWCGHAVWFVGPAGVATSEVPFCIVLQNGYTALLFRRGADGSVIVRRPDGLSPTWSLVPGGLTTTAGFHYMECGWDIDASAGYIKCRIDGGTTYSITGIDTLGTLASTGWTGIAHGAYTGMTIRYDDFVVGDTAGAAPWNDWLGNVQVEALLVTGNGAVQQWGTRVGAATNWQAVEDPAPTGPDDNTSYIAESTAGLIDTYTISDPGAVTGVDVFGVQAVFCATTTTPGSRGLRAVVRQGGVTYVGPADVYLTSGPANYSFPRSMMQVNPATSAQWLMSEVQADEQGVKLSV